MHRNMHVCCCLHTKVCIQANHMLYKPRVCCDVHTIPHGAQCCETLIVLPSCTSCTTPCRTYLHVFLTKVVLQDLGRCHGALSRHIDSIFRYVNVWVVEPVCVGVEYGLDMYTQRGCCALYVFVPRFLCQVCTHHTRIVSTHIMYTNIMYTHTHTMYTHIMYIHAHNQHTHTQCTLTLCTHT